MSFVIYDQEHECLYRNPHVYGHASFSTLRGARGVATRLNKKVAMKSSKVVGDRFVAMDRAEFDKTLDPIVTVFNLMSGRPVQIRKSERGGCCDPSTERYWSM